MKKSLLAFLLLLTFSSIEVLPNGLSLNSIGPRALGMGGAFVGYAKDYSTIYWNPAGLSQLQKNFIGIFTTDVIPMGTYKYNPAPTVNIDAKTKTNHYISPNLVGYWQCTLTDKLTIGLGAYVPAGLGAEWDGAELKLLNGNKINEWMSKIAVINFSPAVSYKVNDQLSLGVALNVFYGMFDLKRPGGAGQQYSESSSGIGVGATIGALYKPIDILSIGFSYRTKTNVKMKGDAENPYMTLIPGLGAPAKSDFDRDVAWPMWIAGGIAVNVTPQLVFTADVQFSQWSKSSDEFITQFKDPKWVAALTPSGQNKFILHWKDATQIRFGTEYTFSPVFQLRGGFYIDPAPATDERYNILFPNISYNVVTLGGSYTINHFVLDAGIEYLIGKDREISAAANPNAMPGTHGMNIFAWSFGIGYTF